MSLKPYDTIGNIELYSAYDVDEVIYGIPEGKQYFWEGEQYMADDYQEQSRKLREFMAKHDMFYYGRPKEDFFVREAVELAKAAGKTKIVMDNMS